MEKVKRLAPEKKTLRQLYVLSGNQCAYPGCLKPMFNGDGNFVGQICHIEAAMPDGERFNSNMTNEKRRVFENLMLMCYEHHIETDKVTLYPTRKLHQMKAEHETTYSDIDGFVNQMSSSIVDVTKNIDSTKVVNLTALYNHFYAEDDRTNEEIDEEVAIFNQGTSLFSQLSPDAKKVFSICLHRAKYETGMFGRKSDVLYINPHEIERVVHQHSQTLRSIFHELEDSGFMYLDEKDGIGQVFYFEFPEAEYEYWELIKRFCKDRSLDVTDLLMSLKFSILDK